MLKEEGYIDKAEILRVLVREARGLEDEGEEEEDGDEGDGVKRGIKNGKAGESKIGVRVPEKAVSEGTKIVKAELEKVVEIEPEVVDFWSS